MAKNSPRALKTTKRTTPQGQRGDRRPGLYDGLSSSELTALIRERGHRVLNELRDAMVEFHQLSEADHDDAWRWRDHREQQRWRAWAARDTKRDKHARGDDAFLTAVNVLRAKHPSWGRRSIARELLKAQDRTSRMVENFAARILRLERRTKQAATRTDRT
jgi:hypothetical protein